MDKLEKKSVRGELWSEYVKFPRYAWLVIGSKVKVWLLFTIAFDKWTESHPEYNKEECFKYVVNYITKEAMRISREGRVLIGSTDEEQV